MGQTLSYPIRPLPDATPRHGRYPRGESYLSYPF